MKNLAIEFQETEPFQPAIVPQPTDGSTLVVKSVHDARAAQPIWAASPVSHRLKLIRRLRHLIAEHGVRLAECAGLSRNRPLAETLTAEVLPLADACRFLEREAEALLSPRKLGARGRPAWLTGVHSEIRREPFGLVLILAPANYPLFLPAVQAIQALVAGNAVLLKPGTDGTPVMRIFSELFQATGLDPRLLQILPENIQSAHDAIEAGVDKVLLTGSAETGAAVLAKLALRLTPSTMELSGCDAVFVRADADVGLAASALAFGLRLNGGATCIAPRRVFAFQAIAGELEGRLAVNLEAVPKFMLPANVAKQVRPLLSRAIAKGACLIAGEMLVDGSIEAPVIIAGTAPSMPLSQGDVWAPVLWLVSVQDDAEALAAAATSPYALGASIFSRDAAAAQSLAQQVNAGVVVINDLIVPTADPRLPFGGRKRSGFGVTRGAEGLLELTVPKAISLRSGRRRPHFEPLQAGDDTLFSAYLLAIHGQRTADRLRALLTLITTAWRRGKPQASLPHTTFPRKAFNH